MSLSYYMDVHIPKVITSGLRLRGIDVLTSQEDGTTLFEDMELLEKASSLNRVLFTFDDDLLVITSKKIERGDTFTGLVYAHQLDVTIGNCIRDLEIIAKVLTIDEIQNQIIFLPI